MNPHSRPDLTVVPSLGVLLRVVLLMRVTHTTGCVQFGGHRIAGLSGTYVAPHYRWGHHEVLPYDDKAVKSIYHVRQLEVHRLMQVQDNSGLLWVGLLQAYCIALRQRLP